jgi:hypothetical protein
MHLRFNALVPAALLLGRAGGTLHDLAGRPVHQLRTTTDRLGTQGLAAGAYLLRAADDAATKLIVN